MPKIIVRYSTSGQLQLECEGYTGDACLATLEKIFQALGRPTTLTPKPEFYLTPSATNTQTQNS